MRTVGSRTRQAVLVAALPAALLCALLLQQPAGAQSRTASTMPMPMPTTSMPMGTGGLPPGDWSPSQRAFLENLIAETEADLPAFADVSKLAGLGFHDFGVPAPGGYVHYINNSWIDDGHILDPTHPESLLFRQSYEPGTYNVTMTLVAAMFFLPSGTTMSNIPKDLAWIPGWHVHTDLCVTDAGTFAGLVNSDGTCSSGHVMDGPPMTHVWIVDNPCGDRFAMIDVEGLMCDADMPNNGHPDGMPTTTMDMTGATDPDMPMTSPSMVSAKAADPVNAQPTYTG